MRADVPATEATKTALENSVSWFLSDKLADASTAIATKKYLTADNQLVYLTRMNAADSNVPRIKVQRYIRVDGGVRETGYQLYADHRLIKYVNDMIFGAKPGTAPAADQGEVGETEAAEILGLVNGLTAARQTL